MCGTKSRHFSRGLAALLSLLLLALSPISGYAEAVYEITESELHELETTLSEQASTIEAQRQTLTRLRSTIDEQAETLTRLSTTIDRQASTIAQLSTSFDEYASAARASEIRTALIAGGIGVGIGAAGVVAALLVIR